MTQRFIDHTEIHLVRALFEVDRRMVGVELDDDELEKRLFKIQSRLSAGQLKVVVVFDDNDKPYAMYTGLYMKKIAGWYIGATKVYKSANHFSQSAKIMAPGLDLLISHMEDQGFYKFWMAAPVWQHNARNKIMTRYSPMLARYDWVDEKLIPQNTRSDIEAFEQYRYICDWSDIMIRMFVLRQEYREELVRKQYETDIKHLEQSRT